MRTTTRLIALGFASVALAACGHKDKNAPLAFVPADTPYVVANLDILDKPTRQALLAQADAQLPAQLAQLDALAGRLQARDPDGAHLLRAFVAELKGGTIETFAHKAGLDLKGHLAFYGLGMAPVLRFELDDPKAFEDFVGRLEAAYGKKLDLAKIGKQSYRGHAFGASGTEVILAVVGKQAVAALLPADVSPAMLRETLGLDRPHKSLQDDGRLAALAKAKGYKPWLVGDLDMTRFLPLTLAGKDPLLEAVLEAQAKAESAKTGEPLANQLKVPPVCATEASRIAARVPDISFGYTRLDARHQDTRLDVALAADISQAFAGLKVNLPGLGEQGSAPFDLSIALPISQLRAFWSAQSDAVAAKPFTCPALSGLNDGFAKIGAAMQKAAIPPFGDLRGLRIALDTLTSSKISSLPTFTGRLVLATKNPAGLLAMGQMMVPALSHMKPGSDGKPVPVPGDMAKIIGQPSWIAMDTTAIALGVGTGEQGKLSASLKNPPGTPGQLMRMHLSGAMYLDWLQLMETKFDAFAARKAGQPAADATFAHSKAQFATMKAQAARIQSVDAEVHVDHDGLVTTSQTILK
ncbi:MAG: hypothetical protein EPN74_14660 [Rhodanobacter sp.]|nr:MAG: hypothetical protein EPN74_14660 [Rhodanobacter sp.]